MVVVHGRPGGLIALFSGLVISSDFRVMPEPRLSPCKGHPSQSEFQSPSDPMLGQSAAEMVHLLDRSRSDENQYEFVDACQAIA